MALAEKDGDMSKKQELEDLDKAIAWLESTYPRAPVKGLMATKGVPEGFVLKSLRAMRASLIRELEEEEMSEDAAMGKGYLFD